MTFEERFWKKVNKNGPIPGHRPELGPCWIWTASKNQCGYGLFGISASRCKVAHVVHWVTIAGLELPAGKKLLHKCDAPACVRLDHLFVGTHTDNMRDMMEKGRQNFPAGENHYEKRMTREQAEEIRRLAATGVSIVELSERFQRKPNTVSKIVHFKLWRKQLRTKDFQSS